MLPVFYPVYPPSCPSPRRLLSFCIHLHSGVAEGNCRRMKSKRGVAYIRVFSARVRVTQRRVCTGNTVEDEFQRACARVHVCVCARARVCDTIPRSWHVFILRASIVSSYSKAKDRNWSVKADVIVSLFFRRAHASAYARVHIAHMRHEHPPVYRCVHHRCAPSYINSARYNSDTTRFVLQYFAAMHVFRACRSRRR